MAPKPSPNNREPVAAVCDRRADDPVTPSIRLAEAAHLIQLIQDLRARLGTLETAVHNLSSSSIPGGQAARILDGINTEFGVPPSVLLSKRRFTRIAEARFAAIWLATHVFPDETTSELAVLFNCHASNISFARGRAEELREAYPTFRAKTDRILASLKTPKP